MPGKSIVFAAHLKSSRVVADQRTNNVSIANHKWMRNQHNDGMERFETEIFSLFYVSIL